VRPARTRLGLLNKRRKKERSKEGSQQARE
jgi:hypothetical protein